MFELIVSFFVGFLLASVAISIAFIIMVIVARRKTLIEWWKELR